MTRVTAAILLLAGLAGASPASAQDIRPVEGAVVVTIVPGGATFVKESKSATEPSFGNYDLGAAFAVNFNRYIGLEGEFAGKLGVSQTLGTVLDVKTPNLLNYTGNVVIAAPNRSAFVPYLAGGIGGLTVLEKASLGIDQTESFLTGNVGGGLKWFAGRWGLRGDYRFVVVQSKDDAPEFFGRETRYAHRVYGAVLVNLGR